MSTGHDEYEKRWQVAGSGRHEGEPDPAPCAAALDGGWRVERLTGAVPMSGLYKVVCGGRGRTGASWSPLPDLGFRLTRLESSVLLIYDSPLSFLRDEFRREADGGWIGRARAFGRQYAWFRMLPLQTWEKETIAAESVAAKSDSAESSSSGPSEKRRPCV